MALPSVNIPQAAGFHLNYASPEAARRDLPPGFVEFLLPLHRWFTPRQQQLIEKRYQVLSEAHRSEEHTSELQSRRDLVCRLLLEKKNRDPDQVRGVCARGIRCG